MADLGTAYVQIVPSAQGISGGITKAIAPEAQTAGMSAGKSIATNIGHSLQSAGMGMMKAGAVATAISVPIIAGIKKAMGAYEVQNTAETKLIEIYKTRMGVSEDVARATMDVASALQQEGVIGDEVLLSGAQQLATFAKYPSTVNSILPAMGNLLAQQKGVNATSQDATGIANLMGKAMQGQVGALKRVGISFSDAQAEILKTGTEEERASVLAQVVTENVGNMNETLADTPSGKIQQMKNAMGDLAEGIGASLAPALQAVAEFISAHIIPVVEKVVNFMKANPVIGGIVVAIAGLLAVGAPLLIMIGAMVSAVGAIIPLFAGLTAPMIAIGVAVGVLVSAFTAGIAGSESFREAIMGLIEPLIAIFKPAIDAIIGAFKTFIAELILTATEIANQLAPVIQALSPAIMFIAKLIAGRLKVAFTVIANVIKVVGAVIRALAGIFSTTFVTVITIAIGAINKLKGIFGRVKEVLTHPFETAKNVIKGIVDKIKGFFGFSVKSPKIPLPHFSISPAGWKIGDLLDGKIPKLSIKWYAQGGIMTQPTLFAGGEAGQEAILPLDPFWKRFDKAMETNRGDITVNVYASDGQDPRAVAEEVKRMLIRETNQRRLAW